MGDDYTIADISILGWVRNLISFYDARELVQFDTFANVASLAGARPRPARRAAGAADPEAGLIPPRERGSIDVPRPFRRFSSPPRGITSMARRRG